MARYIPQLPDWPRFRWDSDGLAKQLASVRLRQGRLIGRMQALGWALIERCSPDTALRDIHDLVDQGILVKDQAGGRSTSYSLTNI
jgi:Fic family protein